MREDAGQAGAGGSIRPGAGLGAAAAKGAVAAVLSALLACEAAPKPDCDPPCTAGSHCAEGQCVADAPLEATPEPAKKKKKRKKKRVRRTSSSGAPAPGGDAPAEADLDADLEAEPAGEPLPPFHPVDDRKIPQFSADQDQVLDLNAGSERPSERVLDQHFAKVTPKITECVITASRYGDVGSGRLAVKLRILPTGKVESVSVKAPASLAVWGIVPCARKAVYDHRFPSFDGPSVGVDFAVDVD